MDLLEEYDLLPNEIKEIFETWDSDKNLYDESSRVVGELLNKGYYATYGLCGEIDTLIKMSNCDINDKCYLKDWIVEDEGLSSNFGTVIGFEVVELPYLDQNGEKMFNFYVNLLMNSGEEVVVNAHEVKKLY